MSVKTDAGKHTRGPWKVEQDEDCYAYVETEKGGQVALIHLSAMAGCAAGEDQEDDAKFDAEMLANAHLIAAAPDLLAALEGVLRVADRATDEFDAARAAIKKARGGA